MVQRDTVLHRQPPRHPHPAEVAALLDLGLSDGAVAAYLLDPQDVAPPRRAPRAAVAPALPPGRAPALYRALGRVSAAAMRKQARRLMAVARHSGDTERGTTLAEHAFELARAAEELERRAAAVRNPGAGDDAPEARWRRRARCWRLRAEEYRTLADALDAGTAHDSYLHLAEAYDALAAQAEPRA